MKVTLSFILIVWLLELELVSLFLRKSSAIASLSSEFTRASFTERYTSFSSSPRLRPLSSTFHDRWPASSQAFHSDWNHYSCLVLHQLHRKFSLRFRSIRSITCWSLRPTSRRTRSNLKNTFEVTCLLSWYRSLCWCESAYLLYHQKEFKILYYLVIVHTLGYYDTNLFIYLFVFLFKNSNKNLIGRSIFSTWVDATLVSIDNSIVEVIIPTAGETHMGSDDFAKRNLTVWLRLLAIHLVYKAVRFART